MTGSAPDTNLPGAVHRPFIGTLNRQDLDAASRLVNTQPGCSATGAISLAEFG